MWVVVYVWARLCSWCVIVFPYGSFDVKIVEEGFEKIVGLNVNVCVCVCVGLIWVMNNTKNYNLGAFKFFVMS